MKNTLKNLVIATFSTLALAPFSAAALENCLPEKTLALAKIENADRFEEQGKVNPLAAEFNAKILTPLFEDLKAQDSGNDFAKFSATMSALSDVFSGEVLFAVIDSNDGGCTPVILATCADGYDLEKIAELYAKLDTGDSYKSISVDGVAGKQSDGDCFAMVGNTFILSDSVPALRKMVNAVMVHSFPKSKKKKSFSNSAAFKKARTRIGNADVWFYLDGNTIAKKIYTAAETYDKEQTEKIQDDPTLGMFSLMMTPVAKAFAPEAIDSLWTSFSFTDDGAVSDGALSWNANKGVVSLITASLKDGIEKPTLFPPSENLAGVSTSSFSIGKFVLQFMNLAREATPLFGIAEMQLMNLKATENLDVSATLVALDNGSFSYTLSSGAPEDTVWVQSVSDETLVAETIKKIVAKFSPEIELKEIPATTGTPAVYSIESECGQTFSVVFVDGKLCAGKAETIEKILSQVEKGKNAPSVWDNVNLKAGESLLPAGGCGMSYAHLGNTLASCFSEVSDAIQAQLEACGDGESPAKDWESLSGLKIGKGDFDYSVVSKTYLGENEISGKTVIYKNK